MSLCLLCLGSLVSFFLVLSDFVFVSLPLLPLMFHFISSLSFSSPSSSPRSHTFVPVNFCTAPPHNAFSLSTGAPFPAICLQPHQPPRGLERPWLACNPRAHLTEVLQSSHLGLRLCLASSERPRSWASRCARCIERPPLGSFGGLTRKPPPLQAAQRPRCRGGKLPGACHQPWRLLRSSVLTHGWAAHGVRGPMEL